MSRLSTFTTRALSAQFLKPTLVLLATLAVGGAWADYFWTAGGGTDTDWNKAANWSGTLDNTANYVFGGYESSNWVKGKDITVTFAGAYSAIPAAGIWIENVDSSGNGSLTWTADTDENGLNLTGGLTIGTATSGKLNITHGTFTISSYLDMGLGDNASSYLTVDSASVTVNGLAYLSRCGWENDARYYGELNIQNGGQLIVKGVDSTDGWGMYVGGGVNAEATINVTSGTLSIPNGDLLFLGNGSNNDTDDDFAINIGTGGTLSIGTESSPKKLATARWGDEPIAITIAAGGILKTGRITRGETDGKPTSITFNGGTIQVLGDYNDGVPFIQSAGITVEVNAQGGTIDVGANAVTIAAPVSGTGTITVKGTGSLTFTGDMSGFCGAVVVETSGCTVTLPASATKAVPGANTSASNGVYSYSANTTHHDWWTGDSSTDWATAGNWGRFLIDEGTTGYDINEWNDNTINIASVVDISKPLTITENDPNNSYNVEFTATSASDGLVSTDVLNVGTSNEGMATFTSGTYSFNNMYVGGSGATGSVTVNGASLTITTGDPLIGNGGTGTFTLSSGFVSFGYAGSAKWAFLKGGTINLDGGEMAVCRLNCDTAPAVINFNGGTLTSYNDGYNKDNIIENDANWTLNVKAGGARFNIPSGLTTTVNQVLAGDAESTGGGLTKLGPGTLILAVAPTFNGGITLHEGSIVIPDTYAENDVMTDVEGYDVSVATGSGVKTYTLTKKTYTDADIASETQIISSKSVTVDIANNVQFIGMVDTCGLTKNGTGTLTLFGQNTIAGPVVVNSGILKLAAVPTDLSNVEFDLDALEVSTLLDSDNNASDTSIVKWKDLSDNCYDATITDESGATLENSGSYFGENKVVKADVVRMTRPGGSNRTTTFLVFRNAENYKSKWDILAGAWASGQSDYGKGHGRYYSNANSASYNEQSNTGSVTVRANITGSTSSQSVEPQVVSIRGNVTKDASYVEFGFAGNTRYWAEVLRLSEELTDSQTQVIEKYLMHKWVVNNTSWSVDYSAAEISVAGGATLDIGSGTWTVSSLGVSGTGIAIVQNGELTITSPISLSDGQILKIPAGSTYTLAEGVRSTTADGVTTLSTAAAHVGSTPFQSVQAAIDAIVAGTATGTLTIHESATVNLSTTVASITDVVLDDGVNLDFAANLPWEGSYSNGTIVNQRVASTFVWTPQDSSTDWGALANWTIGGAVATALPGENDTVEFPSADNEWAVELSSDVVVAAVRFEGATTLSGALILSRSVSGSATVTLDDASGFGSNQRGSHYENMNIVVTASESSPAQFYAYGFTEDKTASPQTIASTCKITGVGAIKFLCENDQGQGLGIAISADLSEFDGVVLIPQALNGARRDNTKINSDGTSERATWKVSNSLRDPNVFLEGNNKVFYFGAYSGAMNQVTPSRYGVVAEIGKLNSLSDSVSGALFSNSNLGRLNESTTWGTVIKKVGTGILTVTAKRARSYEVASGTIVLESDDALRTFWGSDGKEKSTEVEGGGSHWPTVTFSGNSTLALGDSVTVDPTEHNQIVVAEGVSFAISNATDRTFANAIGSGTTGGFTKKGTGTLTLSQPPTYIGTTTVEAGTLVINGEFNTSSTVIAPGATLKVSIPVNGAPANIVVDVKDFESVGITAGMSATEKSAKLKALAANGLAVWQNYVMNINATQKFATVVTPTTGESMTVATSFGSVAGRTGAGVTVSYKLMKKSGETWVQVGNASPTPSFSVDPSTLDANARLRIQAVFE